MLSVLPSAAICAAVSFALTVVAVPFARRLAERYGVMAAPSHDRWHKRPTPKAGGVAIAFGVLGGGLATGALEGVWLVSLCAAATVGIGLVDDLLPLKASTKLIAVIALASVLLFFDHRLRWNESLTLDTMLTLLWIVGITNAVNILDNMDGLASGIVLITCTSLLLGQHTPADVAGVRYLALLMGAAGAFLLYNFHPASIFMGDSGSLFLGFSLAAIVLDANPRTRAVDVVSIVLAPVLIFLLPIFEATLVTLLRLASGRSVFLGGRDHASHRLVAMGLSERAAVGVLWGLAAAGGVAGLYVSRLDASWAALMAIAVALVLVLFGVLLAHIKAYDEDELTAGPGRLTPLLLETLDRRRVAEVMLDVGFVAASYYAAYRLRFRGDEFAVYFPYFYQSLPLILALQMVTLFVGGAYRGGWRHFRSSDARTLAGGVVVGTLVSIAGLTYLYRFDNYSRAVFAIYPVVLLVLLVSFRATFSWFSLVIERRRGVWRIWVVGIGTERNDSPVPPSQAVRDLLPAQQRTYETIVVATTDMFIAAASRGEVDEVIVDVAGASEDELAAIESACARHAVELTELRRDIVIERA